MKKELNTIDEIHDLFKKLLILELFSMNVPQTEIGKKLTMDIKTVNDFLKGIKKNK